MKQKDIFTLVLLVVFISLAVYADCRDLRVHREDLGGRITLNKAAPHLEKLLSEEADIPAMIPVYISLSEQYDTETLYNRAKYMRKPERRAYTVQTLKNFSEQTQKDLRSELAHLESLQEVSRVRYLWIANLIALEASLEALIKLDSHPDIGFIEYDPPQRFLQELPDKEFNRALDLRDTSAEQPTREITYNVINVNAPQVWDLGYNGEGALVAVIDSGVNYNHNDIRERMWIHPDFPNHGYNFFEDNFDPMDNEGHGTHCAGTIAGDGTSGSQTGVAPGATIMALKPLHGFTGQHQTFWLAVQFGVEYEADVLSVSMYWRHTLIDAQNRATFRTIMVNILSAGVVMCKSAGNDGTAQGSFPIPYNVNIPAGSPPPWLHPDQTLRSGVSCVISLGATDSNNQLASWSSIGPATWRNIPGWDDYHYNPGMGLIKPDIVAPGVSVKSLLHTNLSGYTHKSGTSMAAPCAAGVVALMISRNPLLSPERISQIIEETATPYEQTKSPRFGSGRVNALAAVNASTMIAIIDITVSDDNNDIPEYGETVHLNVSLINMGEADATGITATLSSHDEYIQIVNNLAQYGVIEEDSTVTVNEAFTITIAEDVPHNHLAAFDLRITGADERVWNDRFSIALQAPVLVIDSVLVTDDNNNVPEYGETVNLRLRLFNSGGSEARDVTARISSEDPYINIIENSAAFEDIDVNEREVNTDYYVFEIAENTPDRHQALFTVEISGEGNQNWRDEFYLIISSPSLVTLHPTVTDPLPGGNNNGIIDPGETIIVRLPIKNQGQSTAYNVHIDIESADEFSEVISISEREFPQMLPEETMFPAIVIQVSQNVVIRQALTYNYTFTAGEHIFQGQFMLGVGGFVEVQIGEGLEFTGPSNPCPINIYFRSLRGQTVYTAEEIRNAGVTGRGFITAFGYYVAVPPANPLGNWAVGMRHTDAVDVSEHIEGPYVTTYTANQYRPAAGWSMLELLEPFEWNGVDNILINTRFITTAWSGSGQVRYYESENGFRYVRSDVYEQTAGPTVTPTSDKPQIKLTISTTPQSNFDAPHNATARYRDNCILINWQAPGDNRYQSDNVRSRRALENIRDNQSTRNPDGYNVYCNGIKLNTELITETEFCDTTDIIYFPRYYIVTAVYDEIESLNSNIVSLNRAIPAGFNPEPGAFNEPVDITLASDTQNASIYYTLDGSEPTEESLLYQEPFTITVNTVVKTRAYREDWYPSEVSEGRYVILYAPQNLAAESIEDKVNLSWDEPLVMSNRDNVSEHRTRRQAASDRESASSYYNRSVLLGYNVYRTVLPDSFIVINDRLIEERTYIDEGLIDGYYEYYVTAVYDKGESNPSQIVEVYVGETDADGEALPVLRTELFSAYPNPFNPETVIEFTIKANDRVLLEIFNITGKRVATLVDDNLQPGRYKSLWKGDDNYGRKVSSGIYLYRLKTSDYERVKKVIMLK